MRENKYKPKIGDKLALTLIITSFGGLYSGGYQTVKNISGKTKLSKKSVQNIIDQYKIYFKETTELCYQLTPQAINKFNPFVYN